ncbi:hypothetical protein PMIN06_013143 [Paraphaeosphaeria minitans]
MSLPVALPRASDRNSKKQLNRTRTAIPSTNLKEHWSNMSRILPIPLALHRYRFFIHHTVDIALSQHSSTGAIPLFQRFLEILHSFLLLRDLLPSLALFPALFLIDKGSPIVPFSEIDNLPLISLSRSSTSCSPFCNAFLCGVFIQLQ